MKAISFWAKQHPRPARLLVIILNILLPCTAIYTGILLAETGQAVSTGLLYLATIAIIITWLAYPYVVKTSSNRYVTRKSMELFFIASSFTGIMVLANNLYDQPANSSIVIASTNRTTPTAEQILQSLQYRDKSTLTRYEKRILKKEFRKQLKNYALARLMNDQENADQSLLIILTIIAAIGLLGLLAALVCDLSCAGHDAAAVIVGTLGLVGIIWGTIAVIKSINRGPRPKNNKAPPNE